MAKRKPNKTIIIKCKVCGCDVEAKHTSRLYCDGCKKDVMREHSRKDYEENKEKRREDSRKR